MKLIQLKHVPNQSNTIHFQSRDSAILSDWIFDFNVQSQAAKFSRGVEARPVFRDARVYAQAADFWSDAKKIIRGGEMRP